MIDIQRLRKLEQRLPGDQWYCPEDLGGDVLADGTVESDGSWYPSRRIESEARWESDGGTRVETTELGEFDTPALAADVCEMRNALPELLDEVERQRRRVADLERACRRSLDFVNYVGEHAPEVVGEWELAELLMLTLEATE